MSTYPDNGLLSQIEHQIFEDHETNASSTFAEETAGFAEHPTHLIFDDKHDSDLSESSTLLLEKMGVSDPDGVKISGRVSTASVLKKFASKKTGVPDLVLHRSSCAVSEYSNPDLVPGMYPTLFPLGLGGFEISDRNPKLSFETHANALLDVPNKSFRHHQSFIFVILNIIQRRLAHLHTHFTVRKSSFESVAARLTALTPEILKHVADHIEHEHSSATLSLTDRDMLTLLNHINTISARVPGSQSAKIFTRNEICSYFGEFGLPHLFFTFNPSATHSPIFQVMVGDNAVDLTSQFPFVVSSKDRALRLAQDPSPPPISFSFASLVLSSICLGGTTCLGHRPQMVES